MCFEPNKERSRRLATTLAHLSITNVTSIVTGTNERVWTREFCAEYKTFR